MCPQHSSQCSSAASVTVFTNYKVLAWSWWPDISPGELLPNLNICSRTAQSNSGLGNRRTVRNITVFVMWWRHSSHLMLLCTRKYPGPCCISTIKELIVVHNAPMLLHWRRLQQEMRQRFTLTPCDVFRHEIRSREAACEFGHFLKCSTPTDPLLDWGRVFFRKQNKAFHVKQRESGSGS